MNKLTFATEGPCKGHACDNCNACKRGRCCRRDNPNYQLPKEGDWDGPIYGKIGVLYANSDETVQCHACGESWADVGAHARCTHNLTGAEYRAIFGLNNGTPLRSAKLCKLSRTYMLAKIASGKVTTLRERVADRITPEQTSQVVKGRKRRREWQDKYSEPKRRAAFGKAVSDGRKRAKASVPKVC